MFQMGCPSGCGVILESPEQSGILRVYDRHVHENHQASPAQWTVAHEKIVEGKEAVKKANSAQGAEKR